MTANGLKHVIASDIRASKDENHRRRSEFPYASSIPRDGISLQNRRPVAARVSQEKDNVQMSGSGEPST